jgi:ribosomal protein L12E/L44/L45/RPP1/RPP2
LADRPKEPTPEELLDAVRNMRVADLLLSTAATLAQLGFAKLDESTRDLEQARLAVEGLKALLGALEGAVPDEVLRDFNQVVANLQLAYAAAVSGPDEEAEETPKASDDEPSG